jgi:hypothetical protein
MSAVRTPKGVSGEPSGDLEPLVEIRRVGDFQPQRFPVAPDPFDDLGIVDRIRLRLAVALRVWGLAWALIC